MNADANSRSAPVLASEQALSLLELVQDIVFEIDAQSCWAFLNAAWARIIGIPIPERIGKPVVNDIHPDDLKQLVFLATKHYPEYRHELRVRLHSGEWHWFEAHTRLQYDAEQRFCGAVGIMRDISHRHQAEQIRKRTDAILMAVRFAAQRFLRTEAYITELTPVLARFGEASSVSRVYVYQNENTTQGVLAMSKRAEWAAPGFPSELANPELQFFEYETRGFGRWITLLSQGHTIYGRMDEFPQTEREYLQSFGIQSQLVVPIFVDGTWWGFIGFDDCTHPRNWSEAERDALGAAAEIIGVNGGRVRLVSV